MRELNKVYIQSGEKRFVWNPNILRSNLISLFMFITFITVWGLAGKSDLDSMMK